MAAIILLTKTQGWLKGEGEGYELGLLLMAVSKPYTIWARKNIDRKGHPKKSTISKGIKQKKAKWNPDSLTDIYIHTFLFLKDNSKS